MEKPISVTIDEGKKMVQAARKYNRVVQAGTMQRSAKHFIDACELVRQGRVGEVTMVKTWNYGNSKPEGIGTPADGPPPDDLDWDMWLGPAPKRPFNANRFGVDPKAFSDELFIEVDVSQTGSDHVVIPPNSFALCETVETISVPRNVLVLCVGKSTYARCGLVLNVTPLEPEWRGKVTLEISNTTPLPAKEYANEGIGQLVFFKADMVCEQSYADKAGKYQDQSGLTLPKVD